jgi:cytochrome P450
MPEVDFAWDALPDLHERLDELRRHGPVVQVKYHGRPTWLILAHRELVKAFSDLQAFDSAEGYRQLIEPAMGRTLQMLSGKDHSNLRTLLIGPFLPPKVRSYVESILVPTITELLDRLEDQEEVEFVEAFTHPFPFRVVTRLLGIPVVDEPLFIKWAVKILDYPWDPEGSLAARRGFTEYSMNLIAERRRKPTDDFISMLVGAEVKGEKLDDEQILSTLRLLFPAGSDTTYKAAGSMFYCVLADPAAKAQIDEGEQARLSIVNEALRWQTATALLPRLASGDSQLGGVAIKKGDWLLFGITAANNDPEVFPDPRVFNPRRDHREVLSFGRGVHFCLGAQLARRELEVALRTVFARYPDIKLCPERPVEFVGGTLRGPRELWVRPRG